MKTLIGDIGNTDIKLCIVNENFKILKKVNFNTFNVKKEINFRNTIKENQIFVQLTGQPQFEIFAEKADTFFLKVVVAQLVFDRNTEGKVTGVTLNQGGRQMPAKKIE